MQKKLIAAQIRQQLRQQQRAFKASDNIADYLSAEKLAILADEVQDKIQALLDCLIIDTAHDSHTQQTAQRMTDLFLNEILRGRYQAAPEVTIFDNDASYHQLLTLGPIRINSLCSHHFVPIMGQVYIGVIPAAKICGISKFSRLVDWYMARPHVQENATEGLADLIEAKLQPQGTVVLMQATHCCMTWRGVKEPQTKMTTVAKRGVLQQTKQLAEFYQWLNYANGTT